MDLLDLGIGVALAAGALLGLRRGLVRLVALALALTLGWVAGLLLHAPLARRLFGDTGGWGGPVAFLLVLGAVSVVVSLAGRLVARGLSGAGLGWVDRGAGAATGLLLAAALAAAVLQAAMATLPGARPRLLDGSRLGPHLMHLGQAIAPLAPASLPGFPEAPPGSGGGRAG